MSCGAAPAACPSPCARSRIAPGCGPPAATGGTNRHPTAAGRPAHANRDRPGKLHRHRTERPSATIPAARWASTRQSDRPGSPHVLLGPLAFDRVLAVRRHAVHAVAILEDARVMAHQQDGWALPHPARTDV